jgi:hypothetical protein
LKRTGKNVVLVLCLFITLLSVNAFYPILNVQGEENPSETYCFLTQWGTKGTGDGQFNQPMGIAVDKAGYVYVSDFWNHRIEKFTSNGEFVTAWGSYGTGVGQFDRPTGIAADKIGNIYVSDTWNNRIQKFTNEGVFQLAWGTSGVENGQIKYPAGIGVDKLGNVFVADMGNNRVQKFTSDGVYITAWGSTGTGDGQFKMVSGIGISSEENIYVVDGSNYRIQKFDNNGVFLAKWGSRGSGNGQFQAPVDLAVDNKDNILVTDWQNNRIQKFTSDGMFTTTWGSYGSDNGQFISPWRVAVDSAGSVYVADQMNHRIQKFTNDNIAPVIVINTPAEYGVYPANSGQTYDFYVTDNMDPNPTVISTVTGYQGSDYSVNSGDPLPTTSGVYELTVSATDQAQLTSLATVTFVIYDPSAGFVTGGGWFNSPSGAYTADPSLSGKANFGFVSKYNKDASVPTGQTEFQFQTGDLNFHSTSYDWLVVAGTKAQYKGTGTTNGINDCKFMLTVEDGGNKGQDTFRIRIWDATTDLLIYDNGAQSPIAGGSIIVHK